MNILSIPFNNYYYNIVLIGQYVVKAYFTYDAEGRILNGTNTVFNKYVKIILRYFMGYKVDLNNIPIHLLSGTPFEKRVWQTLRRIPYGETRSYKWVAERIKRPSAFRAVAKAVSKNPILVIIPCHRVIKSNGSIGGFTSVGGVELKRKLLRLEGVVIR